VTVEPRVEDLLASIRKAIDDDLGGLSNIAATTSGNSQGTLMRGAMREMRVSFENDTVTKKQADTEISELRNRITRSRSESAFVTPKLQPTPRVVERLTPVPTRGGISEILNGHERRANSPALRPTIMADEPYEAPPYEAPPYEVPPYEVPEVYEEETWEEPQNYAAPQHDDYYQQQSYAPPPQQALVSPQTAYSAQSSFQNLADSIMARATGDRSLEDMTRDLLRGMLKTWLDDNLPELVERLVREEIERVARRGR
jgi:uncharacterized protein